MNENIENVIVNSKMLGYLERIAHATEAIARSSDPNFETLAEKAYAERAARVGKKPTNPSGQ